MDKNIHEEKLKITKEIIYKIAHSDNTDDLFSLELQLKTITGKSDISVNDCIGYWKRISLEELAYTFLIKSYESQNIINEYLDTQILIRNLSKTDCNVNIDNRKISSIVALEFLNLMNIRKNQLIRSRNLANIPYDSFLIDFNNEFDSIKVNLNHTIASYINRADYWHYKIIDNYIKQAFSKEENKVIRKKVNFIHEHNLSVTPVNQEIIDLMLSIYNDTKKEYNIKNNYKNSFMDLLIAATAIYNNAKLITVDKELNRMLKRYSYVDIIADNEIMTLIPKELYNNKVIKVNDIKNYNNNSWSIKVRKKWNID